MVEGEPRAVPPLGAEVLGAGPPGAPPAPVEAGTIEGPATVTSTAEIAP